MTYGILFEPVSAAEFPAGYYYAHIPSLGLTTHGIGIEGAKAAAKDLIELWLAEQLDHQKTLPVPSELWYTTLEIDEHALQSA
jgi:predicted RNase H-like HicB family nuclease